MKMRNINLALFSLLLISLISLPILCVDQYLSHPDCPWQLVPFGADSLSQTYKSQYRILGPQALMTHLADSSKKTVMVLIDGWGVPYDEKMIEDDFKILQGENTSLAMHKRLLGHTSHAENVEYKARFSEGALITSGDSAACTKAEREQGVHFKQTVCCVNCNNMQTIAMLDSLVADTTWSKIGWTAYSTREGDREKLHSLLRGLFDVASKHPETQFVIQGTHRPILGTPETRRKYLAPWVPAVFINCDLKESDAK